MNRPSPENDKAPVGVMDRPDTHQREEGPAFSCPIARSPSADPAGPRPQTRPVQSRATSSMIMAAGFAVLNVAMYLTIRKFWIGGSSFLPMVGILGASSKFLFAFLVNVGVILGAFIGARSSGEFRLRLPRRQVIPKAIVGGALIGAGVTVAPGTCTTAFVTGMPMLSVSSFLSAAGIFIGAFIVYHHTLGRS